PMRSRRGPHWDRLSPVPSKTVNRAAVAFRGFGLERGGELRGSSAFGCQFFAQCDARFGLAVKGAGNSRGAAHFAEFQDVYLESATLRVDLQPIANVYLARWLHVLAVDFHAPQFTGTRGERTSLVEPGRP